MSEPQSVKLVAALDGDGGSQVPEQQDVRSSDVSRRQGSRSVLFLLCFLKAEPKDIAHNHCLQV